MKQVLLSERGLQAGDVINFNCNTRCITLFNPTKNEDIHFEKNDNKYLLHTNDPNVFMAVVRLIALMHQMEIEKFQPAEKTDEGKFAFQFVR